jgi:hypothetical protein
VPFPLSSTAAVVRFLAGIEDRLCGVAATAVGATGAPSHRLLAVGVLSAAAVRATRLKQLGGAAPGASVIPLPGLPGR